MNQDWHGAKWWRQRSVDERVENACIPKRLKSARLDDFGVKPLRAVHTFFKAKKVNDGMGFLISGTDADRMAAAVLHEYLSNPDVHMCGFYTTAQEIVDMSKAEMGEDDGLLPERFASPYLFKLLPEWDWLVVAGLGEEHATPFNKSTLTHLLTKRYNDMKPTMVTTALTSEGLLGRYGPAVARQLQDSLVHVVL